MKLSKFLSQTYFFFRGVKDEYQDYLRFFIPTSDFTKSAKKLSLEKPKVFLIDGYDLANLALKLDLLPFMDYDPRQE
ncbi:MAG: restriction endonuclease [Candidatus Kariarchaeaceae archaeon]